MADHRCFSKKITESDDFLDLPHSTQNLYFHLNMYADDRGFVSNPRSIMRSCRASDDDAKLLLAKKFILGFDGGLILIKGWRMHNTIRKDRFHESAYIEFLTDLYYDENLSYTTRQTKLRVTSSSVALEGDGWLTDGCQVVDTLETEVKQSKEKRREENISEVNTMERVEGETDDIPDSIKKARERMKQIKLGGYADGE